MKLTILILLLSMLFASSFTNQNCKELQLDNRFYGKWYCLSKSCAKTVLIISSDKINWIYPTKGMAKYNEIINFKVIDINNCFPLDKSLEGHTTNYILVDTRKDTSFYCLSLQIKDWGKTDTLLSVKMTTLKNRDEYFNNKQLNKTDFWSDEYYIRTIQWDVQKY